MLKVLLIATPAFLAAEVAVDLFRAWLHVKYDMPLYGPLVQLF